MYNLLTLVALDFSKGTVKCELLIAKLRYYGLLLLLSIACTLLPLQSLSASSYL